MYYVLEHVCSHSTQNTCVRDSILNIACAPVVPTQVPLENQNRVLTYGILGAVVMRAIFIGLGEAAMSVFHPILLGFAAILIFSSYKLLAEGEDDDEDLSDNKLIAFASSALDATDSYDGANFFTVVSLSLKKRTERGGRTHEHAKQPFSLDEFDVHVHTEGLNCSHTADQFETLYTCTNSVRALRLLPG